MFRRRRLSVIASWALACMLFSQAALAALPCLGDRLPAKAIAAGEAMECCAEAEEEGGPLKNYANACLAHCTADLQNMGAQFTMPDTPLPGFVVVQAPPLSQAVALRRTLARSDFPPAPSPLILFKHFRD